MSVLDETSVREQAQKDGVTHLSTGIAVWKNGKVLTVRRVADDFLGGQYELPGGGVDDGETITEAAIREAKEETGLTVSRIVSVFDGFDYTTDRKPHVRQINFLVEVEEGEVVLNPDEHDEYQWADLSTDLDSLMSANMKACVVGALELASRMHLYLLTLEITPLIVGEAYNPLPSHLTLVSRFWSPHSPDKIADAVMPIFAQSLSVELVYREEAGIGPKQTAVHLIENTSNLKNLHSQLLEVLDDLKVSFASPQYTREGYKPHVSKRPDVHFPAGHRQTARHAYLIEVKKFEKEHHRSIRAKFEFGN